MKPLGKRQRAVLSALRRHGEWRPGGLGGWVYGTDSETEAVLKSLERRGLARCVETGGYFGVYVPVTAVDLAKRAEEEGR